MKILITLTFLFALTCCVKNAQTGEHNVAPQKLSSPNVTPETLPSKELLPDGISRLIKAYPDYIVGGTLNEVRWKDGSVMAYDDGLRNKTFAELLNNPDLEDGFRFDYDPKAPTPGENLDPGRIRYEPFFLKMYGATKEEVKANLVEVIWLPKTVNQKILVTKINGVDEKIKMISEELDRMPEFSRHLENIGGTFNWRRISGTDRISTHSFGITIDINTRYSNYWQWDCKCTDEKFKLTYQNKIPLKIVEVFEKHGFIWGGRWYHYDTMHFEYRPELLTN
jgi:hypothetical protein